jgi:hypothetical protein
MNKIALSIAAAVLATGIASAASAATPAATGLSLAPQAQTPANTSGVKIPGTQQAGYFYRYRCYYFRYGYRLYRRCYVRYYYY